MRNLKTYFSVFLFAIALSACSDEENKNSNKFSTTSTTLNLLENKVSVEIPQTGGQHSILVTASDAVTWKVNITAGEDFITVTPFEGQKGNGEINIQIEPNPEFLERKGCVTINNSLGGGKTINFTQEATIDKTFHFAVMGDLHYGLTSKGGTVTDRVPPSMQYITQNHSNLNAFFFVGDITNNGTEPEFSGIKKMVEDNLPTGVKPYFMMGNHDLYGSGKEYYQKVIDQPLNQYIEKNGYPFITLSIETSGDPYYGETNVNFLKVYLAKAAETYPGKPIFVFAHVPPLHTTWGDTWECADSDDLHNELCKYPQVIFFTGHTHFTIEDERSITQDKYTWMNVGPSHYAVISQVITQCERNETYHASGHWVNEALVVDVDEENTVTVTRLNTRERKTISKQWIIKAPHDGSQFQYTAPVNNRADKDNAPTMSGTPTVSEIDKTTCKISFPQGSDNIFVYQYKVDVIATATNEVASTQYVFSEFYWKNNNEPTKLDCKVSGLTPETKYKVSIKAADSFESLSEPIEATFTTEALPPIDPSVPAPEADLVNVVFTTTEVKNAVTGSGLTVEKQGSGFPIGYNKTLRMYVAKPPTTGATISDFYTINYMNNSTYINGVNDGFSWEIYCKASDVKAKQYPMSNLQGAGMGFCFNEQTAPTGATFAAMMRDEKGYKKSNFMEVSSVKANTYYHFLFTWDGQFFSTYKDGVQVSSAVCTTLELPTKTAQYICIGADSGAKLTDAANAFKGEIAVARIYNKAVSASEAASLYRQLTARAGIAEFDALSALLNGNSLSSALATEGWALMNNLATTREQVQAFIGKAK